MDATTEMGSPANQGPSIGALLSLLLGGPAAAAERPTLPAATVSPQETPSQTPAPAQMPTEGPRGNWGAGLAQVVEKANVPGTVVDQGGAAPAPVQPPAGPAIGQAPPATPAPADPSVLPSLQRLFGGSGAGTPATERPAVSGSYQPTSAAAPEPSGITPKDVQSFVRALASGMAKVNPSAPPLSAFGQGAAGAANTRYVEEERDKDTSLKERALDVKSRQVGFRNLLDQGRLDVANKNADSRSRYYQDRTEIARGAEDRRSRVDAARIDKWAAETMRKADPQITINQRINIERLIRDHGRDLERQGKLEKDILPAMDRYRADLEDRIKRKEPLPSPTPDSGAGSPTPTAQPPATPGTPSVRGQAAPAPAPTPSSGAPRPGAAKTSPKAGELGAQDNPHKPTSAAEFNSLASGSWFVNPKDGQVLQKN